MSSSVVDQIVHVTSTFDPSTRLPLVLLDSSQFPPPSSDLYASIVPQIIRKLPPTNFVLLFFACGAPNKPSWSWVAKAYSMLDNDFKKRVKKIYVVHESWWVRAITEMLRGVVSSKFKRKVVHVTSLSQLAQLIDITVINIKPHVYLHNRKIETEITIPRHPMPVFGMPLMNINNDEIILPRVWTEGIQFLYQNGHLTKELFKRPENSNDHTFAALQVILRDCYDRNQLVNLHDYGSRIIASLLRLYIYQLPTPILSNSSIIMINNGSDNADVFKCLHIESRVLLAGLIDLLSFLVHPNHNSRPNNTSGSLAACVGPSLLGNTNGDSSNIASAVRFTKSLIENRHKLSEDLKVYLDYGIASATTTTTTTSTTTSTTATATTTTPTPLPPPSPLRSSSFESNIHSIPMTRIRTYPSIPTLTAPPQIRQDSRSSSVSSTTSTNSNSSSSSTDSEHSFVPPPPPIPRKLALQLTNHSATSPLQVSTKSTNIATKPSNISKSSPTIPKRANIIRRGKMVAELAKLYEERCNTAEILVKIDSHK